MSEWKECKLGGFESLSHRNTGNRTQPLSEALEDSDKKAKLEIKG
jgi:hypothetical protein